MSRVLIDKTYCLRLPDGCTLGHVRTARFEDEWAIGTFSPSKSFENYRELFEREAKLRHEQVIPLWESVADAIESLNIQVVEEGRGTVLAALPVFFEGTEAIIGPRLTASTATPPPATL